MDAMRGITKKLELTKHWTKSGKLSHVDVPGASAIYPECPNLGNCSQLFHPAKLGLLIRPAMSRLACRLALRTATTHVCRSMQHG